MIIQFDHIVPSPGFVLALSHFIIMHNIYVDKSIEFSDQPCREHARVPFVHDNRHQNHHMSTLV